MRDMFFTLEKLQQRTTELKDRRYFGHRTVAPFTSMDGQLGPDEVYCEFPENIEGGQISVGDFFVGRDRYMWFDKETELLPEKDGCKVVGLFDFGKTQDGFLGGFESLLYVNGRPYQGVDTFHNEVVFTGNGHGRVRLTFLVWTGLGSAEGITSYCHQMKQADLAYLHVAADELYYYAETITRTIPLLAEDNTDRTELLMALDRAFLEIDWKEDSVFYPSVERALEKLKKELGGMEKNSAVTVSCTGHTHIDLAWLWRLKHTREKAQRSFSTVLHLMEQYEDYIFLQSQPQLYQFVKEDNPQLYARIREKIKEGKWEAEGGMWVEADCNLISGESLVRQFLYGINFIKEEFGKQCEYLWLPDVFGYSWALPQILKQCGIKTFMTSKISWNQYNEMPNDLFWWQGIDGSRILTYFITTPPEGQDMSGGVTYNGLMTPYAVLGSYKKFKNKELSKEVLIPYGYGDGGGGVTRDMLEVRRKMDEIPGLPRVKTEKPGRFFARLHESVEKTDRYVPVWNGELYLEYHRGTYTSQAYNKKMNRYMENLLNSTEYISTLAYLYGGTYRKDVLDKVWQSILLHQFHDIIPGSSVNEVYRDSKRNYENARREVLDVRDQALGAVLPAKKNTYVICSAGGSEGETLVFAKTGEEGRFTDGQGELAAQKTEGGYYVSVKTKPYQLKQIRFCPEKELEQKAEIFDISPENRRLVTPYYEIRWTKDGRVESIYDREKERQVLEEGQYGNVLEVYEDKPLNFDAWDIDLFYMEKMERAVLERPAEIIENGSLKASVRFWFRYHNSKIVQDMTVYRDSRRIDFVTKADWQESQRLLKAAFYTSVHATKALYDIQFGYVERPTHFNTSWDMAKFEVCGHKWADLSETGYGVSLMNNCKYGYSIHDNAMKISLLKSAKYPDRQADIGEHEFTYSLYPHTGSLTEGGTIEEADRLNMKPSVFRDRTCCGVESGIAEVSSSAVKIDAVKKAEKEDCLIVRMHECYGSTVKFVLTSQFAIRKAVRCNLLEEDVEKNIWTDEGCALTLHPFEICTVKLYQDIPDSQKKEKQV